MKPIEHHWIECGCYCAGHAIRFSLDGEFDQTDPDLPMFSIAAVLSPIPCGRWSFFKRLWLGIKYICGRPLGPECDGHFMGWEIHDPADFVKIRDLAERGRGLAEQYRTFHAEKFKANKEQKEILSGEANPVEASPGKEVGIQGQTQVQIAAAPSQGPEGQEAGKAP
jgi:hypothetical protein